MSDLERFLDLLRQRYFPQWKHPYAHESVYHEQQEREARAQVHNWFALYLAEL